MAIDSVAENVRLSFNCRALSSLLKRFNPPAEPLSQDPCRPSPCGPNSQCRVVNGQAVCSCVQGYLGTPPSCRPECVLSSDCPRNLACSNQKCIDPCLGTCGLRTQCQVVGHNPICSCLPRHSGDPFARCDPIRKENCMCIMDIRTLGLSLFGLTSLNVCTS